MKLSILVLTLASRVNNFFPKIITSLDSQIKDAKRKDIELLALLDNKTRSIGEKRNALLHMSSGAFITFVDDDDIISDNYIEAIIKTIDANPDADCIVYKVLCTVKNSLVGKADKPYSFVCEYGIEFEKSERRKDGCWHGKPSHTMIWESSIAKKYLFPTKNRGEDVSWVQLACPDIKKQVKINSILYCYNYDAATSASLDYMFSKKHGRFLTAEERKKLGVDESSCQDWNDIQKRRLRG